MEYPPEFQPHPWRRERDTPQHKEGFPQPPNNMEGGTGDGRQANTRQSTTRMSRTRKPPAPASAVHAARAEKPKRALQPDTKGSQNSNKLFLDGGIPPEVVTEPTGLRRPNDATMRRLLDRLDQGHELERQKRDAQVLSDDAEMQLDLLEQQIKKISKVARQAQDGPGLQDYNMAMMLLEQQHKKRLMMARLEQDDQVQRMGDTAVSPPGSRSGASPGPADQMKRSLRGGAIPGSPSAGEHVQGESPPPGMNFMNMTDLSDPTDYVFKPVAGANKPGMGDAGGLQEPSFPFPAIHPPPSIKDEATSASAIKAWEGAVCYTISQDETCAKTAARSRLCALEGPRRSKKNGWSGISKRARSERVILQTFIDQNPHPNKSKASGGANNTEFHQLDVAIQEKVNRLTFFYPPALVEGTLQAEDWLREAKARYGQALQRVNDAHVDIEELRRQAARRYSQGGPLHQKEQEMFQNKHAQYQKAIKESRSFLEKFKQQQNDFRQRQRQN